MPQSLSPYFSGLDRILPALDRLDRNRGQPQPFSDKRRPSACREPGPTCKGHPHPLAQASVLPVSREGTRRSGPSPGNTGPGRGEPGCLSDLRQSLSQVVPALSRVDWYGSNRCPGIGLRPAIRDHASRPVGTPRWQRGIWPEGDRPDPDCCKSQARRAATSGRPCIPTPPFRDHRPFQLRERLESGLSPGSPGPTGRPLKAQNPAR